MLLDNHVCGYCFADTSRHYFPIYVIKQIIESMSYAKLVRFVTWYSCQGCVS